MKLRTLKRHKLRSMALCPFRERSRWHLLGGSLWTIFQVHDRNYNTESGLLPIPLNREWEP